LIGQVGRKLPSLSVVVPTFARTVQLKQCLWSLACLGYPKDRFEVVVMDEGFAVLNGDDPNALWMRNDCRAKVVVI
jgi:GT2 family glycosyltransferase